MQGAPKYSKIELIILGEYHPTSQDDTKKGFDEEIITYEDCGMFITGDYLVIVEDTKDETGNANSVTDGTVYHMSKIKQYKTYSE